ncbi:Hypothetical predicted protein [Paramuricea clavata]|uniref:Uncharacterized protein n=1 Tax=Paramuricea clavata TaxID=317549 RepID=A0A7D9JE36_PARCT|nr:Hypothetical predicted protein [Paramuricea clavata]
MWKYFYSASTYKWLDVLQDLTDNYNSSVNRSIKTTPDSVNESNWTEVWKTLFSHNLGKPSEPKFAVGESVRISKYKSVFTKGYEANFTEELFTVTEVYHGHPNTYTIKDSADEPIIGRFYEQELYSAEGREPDFRIEKVLRRRTVKGIMEDYDDRDDTELEEVEKSYPQYDDLDYDDLTTAFNRLDIGVKAEAMYGDDPIVLTDLKSELDYVKNLMERPEIEETTFTEGNDGTVNISGPSGSTTTPGVDFVEDPNNVLPDVLDAFNESFDADWDEIEARLEKLNKISTENKKRDFENQVERVQAVARVIKGKEGLVLDPKNKYVRELIKRSSVRTLNDGTEVLVFRSEQGIDKSGTQIMKRGKTSKPVYSKNSPALREYKDLIKKIKEVPTNPDNIIGSDEDTREEPQFDTSDEEYADRENIELIDISVKLRDLPGLTMQENNELRGVLNPPDGSSIEGRTGPNGALQIQADYFNEAINETVKQAGSVEGVTEYNALIERIDSLKEARDRTLEQRVVEEAREAQLEDISRLRKFIDWVGKEKVGLVGIAVSTASLITALLIHARGAIVKTAKTTSKVAKALANLAKKAGPILVPILNAVATALSWGAKGIAWLASNLWVLAVAAALIVYNYYTK